MYVHDTVQPSESGGRELQLGDCQALRSSCDDLDNEPGELQEGDPLGESVALALILNLVCGNGR